MIERLLYRLAADEYGLVTMPWRTRLYWLWHVRPWFLRPDGIAFRLWKARHPQPEWTYDVLARSLLVDPAPDGEGRFPHCDALILHRPGECEYCDRHPRSQQHRITRGIPFAGEPGCPESLFRPMETAYRWGGNRAAA